MDTQKGRSPTRAAAALPCVIRHRYRGRAGEGLCMWISPRRRIAIQSMTVPSFAKSGSILPLCQSESQRLAGAPAEPFGPGRNSLTGEGAGAPPGE